MTRQQNIYRITQDPDVIYPEIEKHCSKKQLDELIDLLSLFGVQLCLLQINSTTKALGFYHVATNTYIPISFSNFENISFFSLNDKSPGNKDRTPLSSYVFIGLINSLNTEKEQILATNRELHDTQNLFTKFLNQLGNKLNFEIGMLDYFGIHYPFYLLRKPEPAIEMDTWDLSLNSKNPYPTNRVNRPGIRLVVIVPERFTVQNRVQTLDGIQRLIEETNLPIKRDEIALIDKPLIDSWQQNYKVPKETGISQIDESEDLDQLTKDVLTFLQKHTNKPKVPIQANLVGNGLEGQSIILLNWNDQTIKHSIYPLPPVYGWTAKKERGEYQKVPTPYDNVLGIVCVQNRLDAEGLKFRKELARSAMNSFKNFGTAPKSIFLTVDRDLLDFWASRRSPFASLDEINDKYRNASAKKQADYGVHTFREREKPPLVYIDWWEPDIGSHIGAPQLRINAEWDESYTDSFVIDLGWIFSRWKKKGALDFRQPHEGIKELIDKKMFAPNLRLYRSDLLIFSIDDNVIKTVLNHAETSGQSNVTKKTSSDFIMAEVFHREGLDGLIHILENSEKTHSYFKYLKAQGKAGILFSYLAKIEKEFYQKKHVYWGLGITHAHQDHAVGSSITRPIVQRFFSPITQTLLKTDFLASKSNFLIAETAMRRMYDQPMVKKSYQIEEYPHQIMHSGQRIEVAPGFFITTYGGHHSIPGELGFVWEIYHHGKLVSSGSYGGDDKDGHFHRQLQEHAKHISPIDIGFIEGTNDARTQKKGAFTNEDDVADNFEVFFRESASQKNIVVVDLLKNNTTRLFNLIKIALEHDRKIALSPKILLRLLQLKYLLDSSAHSDLSQDELQLADQIRWFLSILYGGNEKITCWKRYVQTYKPYENELFASFGTCTPDTLSSANAQNNKFLVIREYGEDERKISGIATDENIPWIQSTYAAYDPQARLEKEFRQEFARINNLDYIDSGFHTSGHGVMMPKGYGNWEHGIAHEAVKVGFDEMVVVHTAGGRKYISEKVLPSYNEINDFGTLIHTQVNEHPRPRITPRAQFTRWNRD